MYASLLRLAWRTKSPHRAGPSLPSMSPSSRDPGLATKLFLGSPLGEAHAAERAALSCRA